MDLLDESELEDIEAKQDRASLLKGVISGVGGIMQNQASVPSAYEYLYDKKMPRADFQGTMDRVAGSIRDPMETKKKAMEYMKAKREESIAGDQDEQRASLKDPNSVQSKARKALAQKYGVPVTPEMSGYDVEQMMDPKRMFEKEAASQVDFDNDMKKLKFSKEADLQKYFAEKRLVKDQKDAEETKERTTPYGVARTGDDAKKLKEAGEIKADMDSKMQELIDLRTKHNGGANSVTSPEDVARAKQLSKDLLLQQKQLAGLGVLSKTDMDLVNQIIPDDPLQYNVSGLWGQDPTMHKLKKFKEDTNNQFNERLKNRLQNYQAPAASPPKTQIKVVNGVTYRKVDGGWEEAPSLAGQ